LGHRGVLGGSHSRHVCLLYGSKNSGRDGCFSDLLVGSVVDGWFVFSFVGRSFFGIFSALFLLFVDVPGSYKFESLLFPVPDDVVPLTF
jgi:hypothetical protein